MIHSLLSTEYIIQIKLVHQKGAKIDDVTGLSPNHVLSSNNGNNYYLNTNFENV